MTTAVSESCVARPQSRTPASRDQAGTDQASASFSELLDGETPESTTTPSTGKPADGASAEAAQSDEKPTETVESASPEGTDPALEAMMALVMAALGDQQAATTPQTEPAIPVSPDAPASGEAKPGTDTQPDAAQPEIANNAAAPDAQIGTQPATAPTPVATPVPTAAPAIAAGNAGAPAAEAGIAAVAGASAAGSAATTAPAADSAMPDATTPDTDPALSLAGKTDEPANTDAVKGPAADKKDAVKTEQTVAPETKTAKTDTAKSTAEPATAEPKLVARTHDAANAAKTDAADVTKLAATLFDGQDATASTNAGANVTAPPPAPIHTVAAAAPVATVSTYQPDADTVPLSGLGVAIASNAHEGKNNFEIRLDPPELGRIDVQLQIDSDGQVTSHLRVERPETLDLLRRDAQALERALQQSGLKTSDSGLQFSLRDQSFSQQQQQGREQQAAAHIVVPDDKLAPIETQRYYGRLFGAGRGVDIRI